MASLRCALAVLAWAAPGLVTSQPAAQPAAQETASAVAGWRPYTREASRRCGVPVAWIERVMQAESRGRTVQGGRPIRSRAGAIGLMQLMPATWSDMRARLGLGSDPDDPRDNILAGTCFLRLMYERFGYPGLFAAYNAGPARYAAYLAGHQGLPRETIGYLASVAPDMQGKGQAAATVQPEAGLFAVRRMPTKPPAESPDTPSQADLFVALSPGP